MGKLGELNTAVPSKAAGMAYFSYPEHRTKHHPISTDWIWSGIPGCEIVDGQPISAGLPTAYIDICFEGRSMTGKHTDCYIDWGWETWSSGIQFWILQGPSPVSNRTTQIDKCHSVTPFNFDSFGPTVSGNSHWM